MNNEELIEKMKIKMIELNSDNFLLKELIRKKNKEIRFLRQSLMQSNYDLRKLKEKNYKEFTIFDY